jgi:hypothetical protein
VCAGLAGPSNSTAAELDAEVEDTELDTAKG